MELLTKCNDSLYNSMFYLPGKHVCHKIFRRFYEPKLFQYNNIEIILNGHVFYTLDKPNTFKIKRIPVWWPKMYTSNFQWNYCSIYRYRSKKILLYSLRSTKHNIIYDYMNYCLNVQLSCYSINDGYPNLYIIEYIE